MENCIFCKIVKKEIPSYVTFENDDFMAFLDIFPEAPGMTIIVPKEHMSSYLPDLPENTLNSLMQLVQKLSLNMDQKLENVIRTSVVFEGMDVDHIHAKLIPIYKKENFVPTPNARATDEELLKMSELLKI